MTVDDIIILGQRAMMVTLLASAPMLIAGMVVGLVISILQSVTQIQEMTLAFIPKIIAVFVAFIVFLPWITDLVIIFTQELIAGFDTMVMR